MDADKCVICGNYFRGRIVCPVCESILSNAYVKSFGVEKPTFQNMPACKPAKKQTGKITSAAVKLQNCGNNEIIVLRCHRHGDVYDTLRKLGFKPSDFKTIEQGFIVTYVDEDDEFSSTEKFMNRKDAYTFAKHISNQVDETIGSDELYSEDLW